MPIYQPMNGTQVVSDTVAFVNSIFYDLSFHMVFRTITGALLGFLAYMVGIDNIALFGALMMLVVIEFVMRVLSFTVTKIDDSKIKNFCFALETNAFGAAVQLVTYGLMVSSAHLTETLLFSDTFLDKTMIGFLGISQLSRILHIGAGMGYAIPVGFIEQLQNVWKGGRGLNNPKG